MTHTQGWLCSTRFIMCLRTASRRGWTKSLRARDVGLDHTQSEPKPCRWLSMQTYLLHKPDHLVPPLEPTAERENRCPEFSDLCTQAGCQ